MSSLCGVYVRIRVRVNNFFSKTTRPRDMLFFLKDTLSIEDEKLFKACNFYLPPGSPEGDYNLHHVRVYVRACVRGCVRACVRVSRSFL